MDRTRLLVNAHQNRRFRVLEEPSGFPGGTTPEYSGSWMRTEPLSHRRLESHAAWMAIGPTNVRAQNSPEPSVTAEIAIGGQNLKAAAILRIDDLLEAWKARTGIEYV